MKVWVKLFIGSILGIVLGFLLPDTNIDIMDKLEWLQLLAIRAGRYVAPPFLVFSLTIAIYELRQDQRLWGLVLKTALCIIGMAAIVIGAGLLAVVIFTPARIPILIDEQLEAVTLDILGSIIEVFPSNMFEAVVSDGVFLFPLCVFAFFLSMGLSYDRNYTKPVITLIDSLSRIAYHIASFFSEILGIMMIALAAYWSIRFHAVLRTAIFPQLIAFLGIFSVLFCFGILPLFLYLLPQGTNRVNPWVVLYGSLSQAVTAFFSGDMNFTLPVILRQLKENMGVKRRCSTVCVSLFTTFGRAGSAAVAAASFIVIIKSYSSLGIPLENIFTIGLQAFLLSFVLAKHPGDGAYSALAILCLGYGRGFEAGYLILKPMAFYLVSIGTFMDIMICSFTTVAISRLSNLHEDKAVRYFV
ncbi:dicarboxylate/amino acid:cation symporter [Breznakiellaceae bacterium SP9]